MLVLRTALSILLALFLAAPAAAQAEEAPTPLLQAMAYLHPKSDPMSVSFVDWAQLKRLHGSEDVTSASPLEDRQRFLLEIARGESVPVPLGIDRLATWPETWGWDNTDLDWQARYLDGRDVLRFGEHWDPAPFRAALKSFGYTRDSSGSIEVWLPPEARMSTDLRLERMGTEIGGLETSHTYAPVTIDGDGRTVIIHSHGPVASPKKVHKAARPDLEKLAGTPAVRAASALGGVVAADIAASSEVLCRWPGEEDPFADDPEVGAIVGELHRYEARASGYTRETSDAPIEIRYVFSYRRPRYARADLEGRGSLIQMGSAWTSPAMALPLTDAHVEDKELLLDVELSQGHPGPYSGWRIVWAPFAMCGP